jgi:hypothetical protein
LSFSVRSFLFIFLFAFEIALLFSLHFQHTMFCGFYFSLSRLDISEFILPSPETRLCIEDTKKRLVEKLKTPQF